ncbi:lipoate--protein ligase family protein [Halovivax gelatinilyticus]|uniref:lipoate--protein ligase family protein n=1 Tax=Halovivax gelatinilyticus TaxID=2961597 RepID=UPI0020CA4E3A|nr:lipoate--protein ligase family protein [Halovivax gelatinilyticus]
MTVTVYRGRAATIDADRDASRRLLEHAAAGERAVRVWRPHRQVAFGRRDENRDGYDLAREAARSHGFRPVSRRVGGRAVAYDGETTLAFVRAEPVEDLRTGIQDRYDAITADVTAALESSGVAVAEGEPANAFCPGTHSLRLPDGPKVSGIAQRVTGDGALVAGILLVDRIDELAAVLADVYDALDVPLDPGSVGGVARATSSVDPADVRRSLEGALAGDAATTVISIEESD